MGNFFGDIGGFLEDTVSNAGDFFVSPLLAQANMVGNATGLTSGGLFGSGGPDSITNVSQQVPWAPLQPHLQSMYTQASTLPVQRPYPGATVAPTNVNQTLGRQGLLRTAEFGLPNIARKGMEQFNQLQSYGSGRGWSNDLLPRENLPGQVAGFNLAPAANVDRYQSPSMPGRFEIPDAPSASPTQLAAMLPPAQLAGMLQPANLPGQFDQAIGDVTQDPGVQAQIAANRDQVTQAMLEDWLPRTNMNAVAFGGMGGSGQGKAQQLALGRGARELGLANAATYGQARGQNVTARGQDVTARGQDITGLLTGRGQDVQQIGQNLAAYLQGRGQDVTQIGQNLDAYLTGRGQDLTTALGARGQTLESLLGQRQQDLTGRGQDITSGVNQRAQDLNRILTSRGQNLESLLGQRTQDINQRNADINALINQRNQDYVGRGQNLTARGQNITAATGAMNFLPTLSNLQTQPYLLQNMIGEQIRADEQRRIDAEIARHNFTQQAPYDRLGAISSILQGGPGYGTTTATGPNPNQRNEFQDLLGLGLTGAGLFMGGPAGGVAGNAVGQGLYGGGSPVFGRDWNI
jgi:hypothetical protein